MAGKVTGGSRVTPCDSGKLKVNRTRNDGQKLALHTSDKKYNDSCSSKKYFQDSFRDSVSDMRKLKGSSKTLQDTGCKAYHTSRHDHQNLKYVQRRGINLVQD
jgi:hypothetical protein